MNTNNLINKFLEQLATEINNNKVLRSRYDWILEKPIEDLDFYIKIDDLFRFKNIVVELEFNNKSVIALTQTIVEEVVEIYVSLIDNGEELDYDCIENLDWKVGLDSIKLFKFFETKNDYYHSNGDRDDKIFKQTFYNCLKRG